MQRRSVVVVLALAAALSWPAWPATKGSGTVRFHRLSTQADFLTGSLEGIAVDPLGVLSLASRAERLAKLDEPFVFAIAEHRDGWVVGTGNDGNVLLVRRDGSAQVLFSTPEPEVFAVWSDSDGAVLAGSSPDGKVYRWKAGELTTVFDPPEVYIWDLERGSDGALLVATGAEGRLYRVGASGSAKLLYDTEDTHLKTISRQPDGGLLLGTAGDGLILRLSADGKARTLYDSPYPEVVAMAAGPGGRSYAALLASEASLVDLSSSQGSRSSQETSENGKGAVSEGSSATVEVSVSTEAGYTGSRPSGFTGARSVLLQISPSGATEKLWTFDSDTVYSLLWRRDRLWIGTGLDGKLFSFRDGNMVLEKDVDERQIVGLAGGDSGPAFATTNGAAVFRLSDETERKGRFVSPSHDAGQISEFGTLMWRGARPQGGSVSFSARSGMSAEPDRTWSSWSSARDGDEIPLGELPPGRFVQWRVDLGAGNGESPRLTEVVVSYLQHNLAPRIESLSVRPPGEVVVPAGFTPGKQVFEPAHPDRGGIFTTLEPARRKDNAGRKTLWKRGFRTFDWSATDPNDDELTYSLFFRREASQGEWMRVAEEIAETSFSFDSTVLPDGEYRFLLRAADRKPGSGAVALAAEKISEPVVVDHTPPRLVGVERRGARMIVKLDDRSSALVAAEVSVDAGDWTTAAAADGMLDGRSETLEIEVVDGADLLLLRVRDSAFNSATFDLLEAQE